MKIRLSELRQIIREEIESTREPVDETAEDDAQFQKIMSMITSTLGSTPAADKLGLDLKRAFAGKNTQKNPTSLSMTSVARKPTPSLPGDTISMRSTR